jgi:hypothetical protein
MLLEAVFLKSALLRVLKRLARPACCRLRAKIEVFILLKLI